MEISAIIIVQFICSLGLFFLLRNFYTTYFNKKGENQATKEDIAEITKEVENVKKIFNDQNTILNAKLSFQNQHALNLRNAEREALIDFNKKLSAWLQYIYSYKIKIITENNIYSAEGFYDELEKREYEYQLAYGHIQLFISNENILKHSENMVSVIKDLSQKYVSTNGILLFYYKQQLYLRTEKKEYTDFDSDCLRTMHKFFNSTPELKEKIDLQHKQLISFIRGRIKELNARESDETD